MSIKKVHVKLKFATMQDYVVVNNCAGLLHMDFEDYVARAVMEFTEVVVARYQELKERSDAAALDATPKENQNEKALVDASAESSGDSTGAPLSKDAVTSALAEQTPASVEITNS